MSNISRKNLMIAATVIIISNILSIVGTTVVLKGKSLSYESYVKTVNFCMENLQKEGSGTYYETIPQLTSYPGNAKVNKNWADSEMDAINDDFAYAKQKAIYHIDESGDIFTRVILSYAPEIKSNCYLSVNRILYKPVDAKNIINESPVDSLSLASNGIFVQVITIYNGNNIKEEGVRGTMAKINMDIMINIQRSLLLSE